MSQKNLEAIFNPQSIAIVGASIDESKLGTVFIKNLIKDGYKGKIYPINPKYDELLGLKCYAKVSDIEEKVDQVAILIPAQFVLDVIKDSIEIGVKAALIISAGFGEIGEAGQLLENEILATAAAGNMRIVGPNIIGAINPHHQMNSSWMQALPLAGDIAFASQSGAFCTTVLDVALNSNLGFHHFCSMGNKADVDELDLIEYWQKDPQVKVISAYIEEIKHGQDFTSYLEKELTKPLVIFKPGKSNEAKAAISSHTGSMAGSYETVVTALQKAGVIQVDDTRDFFNALMVLSWTQNMPQSNRVAIITNAGGPGIMCTDDIVSHGLKLAELTPETKTALKAALPAAASSNNPVDVLGEAPASRYQAAAEIVATDKNVDMILFLLTPQYVTDPTGTAQIIIDLKKAHPEKTIMAIFMGDKFIRTGIEMMHQAQVPAFTEVDSAVKALSFLYQQSQIEQNRNAKIATEKYKLLNQAGQGKYTQKVNEVMARSQEEVIALPDEMMDLLAAEVGFDLPRQTLTTSLAAAKEFSQAIYPIVIKAPNKTIAHKTDVKAVYVGIKNDQELSAAYTELEQTIKNATDNNNSPEILIQEMIKAEEELFIGANRDGGEQVYQAGEPGFGHLIVTGKGGIYTEVYKDLAYALIPSTQAELEKALYQTKTSQIITGTRGQAPLAGEAMIDAIAKVQKLLILYPQIVSLDINPILLTHKRAIAVDIKVFLSK